MAGITGMGTTYNLPNYVGELFAVSREDTPLLSAIGGLTGGRPTKSTVFGWQTYDLRDAEDDRQRLEGADAPEAESRVRSTFSNVTEIHQETIDISYTKLGATDMASTNGAATIDIGGNIIPQDEMAWQLEKEGDSRYANSIRCEFGSTRPGTKSRTGIKRPYARVIIGDPTAGQKEKGSQI